MNITTKFSTGQEVFAIMEQKIAWGIVEGIECKALLNGDVSTLYKVRFVYNGNEFVHAAYEETLFETANDLLMGLAKQLTEDIEIYQQEKKSVKKPAPDNSWTNIKSWIP
jgi:hypothetical protein